MPKSFSRRCKRCQQYPFSGKELESHTARARNTSLAQIVPSGSAEPPLQGLGTGHLFPAHAPSGFLQFTAEPHFQLWLFKITLAAVLARSARNELSFPLHARRGKEGPSSHLNFLEAKVRLETVRFLASCSLVTPCLLRGK